MVCGRSQVNNIEASTSDKHWSLKFNSLFDSTDSSHLNSNP